MRDSTETIMDVDYTDDLMLIHLHNTMSAA